MLARVQITKMSEGAAPLLQQRRRQAARQVDGTHVALVAKRSALAPCALFVALFALVGAVAVATGLGVYATVVVPSQLEEANARIAANEVAINATTAALAQTDEKAAMLMDQLIVLIEEQTDSVSVWRGGLNSPSIPPATLAFGETQDFLVLDVKTQEWITTGVPTNFFVNITEPGEYSFGMLYQLLSSGDGTYTARIRISSQDTTTLASLSVLRTRTNALTSDIVVGTYTVTEPVLVSYSILNNGASSLQSLGGSAWIIRLAGA